ncbi:MAG: hypothetical protein AAGU19_13475 [Prolixibacteraceae bacterium]
MKRILLIGILVLSIFSLAQAQRNTGQRPSKSGDQQQRGMMDPVQRVERQTERLTEALSLNADQVTKVKAILTKNAEKRQKDFEKMRASGAEPDRDKMRENMKAANTQQDNEIKALLTAEQKVKYEQVIKEREERMKNWQGRQGGAGGPAQN